MWFRASEWTGRKQARGWMEGNIVSYVFSIQLIFRPVAWWIKGPLEHVIEKYGGVGGGITEPQYGRQWPFTAESDAFRESITMSTC